MAAILFFKMAANPTNSWYRPISTQNVHRITCLGLYPGFLSRRIDWNNYLPEIDKLWNMFFKMAAIPTNFHHISAYSGHTVVILIAIPRFFGSRNPVEQSFKHINALKRTRRPVCFSNWPPIQPILDYKPISVHHVQELSSWWLYPGFRGRRINWDNYLRDIEKLYTKYSSHVFQNGCHSYRLWLYSGHTIVVLMAIPRFYWQKNPNRTMMQ